MAILIENAPSPISVQLVDLLFKCIIGTNPMTVQHVRRLLERLVALCELQVQQTTIDEDWLTEVTGTGGGLGGFTTNVRTEIVDRVLKIEQIRLGIAHLER